MWSTTGATSLSIDHGVGTVTGTSINVSPSATTTYTLTATNPLGSTTASATIIYMPIAQASSQVYYSEHAMFIIPSTGQVDWNSSDSWDSLYSTNNVNSYVATLKSVFPDDYYFVVVAANNLSPNIVPSVIAYRHEADGIGLNSAGGVGTPSICRYNIGGGTVIPGAFGVLDHEIGHNWGVFVGLGPANSSSHWVSNSTAGGQMSEIYSDDDDYVTDKVISGDPINGFSWTPISNITVNETETFNLQDLYLQGLNDKFPPIYVLNSPVYNSDNTMSYSSVSTYDQNWVIQHNGARNPSYQTSNKTFRMAVVYIARDLSEIQTVYQPIEESINDFVNGEQIDNVNYRFQVPYLVDTQFRASANALLADLDGNHTPTLTINGFGYLVSSDGNATVAFTAADADGPAPVDVQ